MKINVLSGFDISLPGTEAVVGDTVQIVGDSAPGIAPLGRFQRQTGILEEVRFLGLSRVTIMGKPVFVADLHDLRVVGSRDIVIDDVWLGDNVVP